MNVILSGVGEGQIRWEIENLVSVYFHAHPVHNHILRTSAQ